MLLLQKYKRRGHSESKVTKYKRRGHSESKVTKYKRKGHGVSRRRKAGYKRKRLVKSLRYE